MRCVGGVMGVVEGLWQERFPDRMLEKIVGAAAEGSTLDLC
jgi:hypothetical protein